MSRYREQVLDEVRKCKSACRTMGPPNQSRDPPSPLSSCSHTRKELKEAECNQCGDKIICSGSRAGHHEKSVESIVNTIGLPLKISPQNVSQPIKQINQLCRHGLFPFYVHKPAFGQVPVYLQRRIRQAANEEERKRNEEIRKQILCQYIPNNERNAVLEVYIFVCI